MKKVTLKELVAGKIIFAVLVALYYWMWARNDWKDFYHHPDHCRWLHVLVFCVPRYPGAEI